MISKNELRIGNWAQVLGVYKDSFLKAGIVQVDAELILLVEQSKVGLLPIPLTPEILEKCGFKGDKMSLGLLTIKVMQNWVNVYDEFIHASGVSFPCEHLHQLQNLYYALTGEELEVKI